MRHTQRASLVGHPDHVSNVCVAVVCFVLCAQKGKKQRKKKKAKAARKSKEKNKQEEKH